MTVDPTTFRDLMGHFATGCTVVTFPADPPHGMTVNAFASVSLDPPLCLICVDHDTRSYELLDAEGIDAFGVTMLTTDQRDIAEYFADMTDLPESPFESRPTRTAATGTPVFEDGLAFLDCTVDAAHPAGDHTIYVGRVEAGGRLNGDADPLTFYQGAWGTLAADD